MGKLNRCWFLLLVSLLFELDEKDEKLKKPLLGGAEFRTSIDEKGIKLTSKPQKLGLTEE